MTNPSSEHVQLLVIGAGPVGLFAGLCAARRGLRVLLIDHVWRGYSSGYAALVHANSLKLMEDVDLVRKLERQGKRIERIGIRADGGNVITCELVAPALVLPQAILEETLLGALREAGVEVRSPHQAATIEQHADAVDVRVLRRELVTVGSPAPRSEWEPVESSVIQADFVIGADGYDSRVRAALGIDVTEVGNGESFALFEVSDYETPDSTSSLFFDDGVGSLVLPMPEGRARLSFQLTDQLDAAPDIERLRALLAARRPSEAIDVGRVEWGSVMHFERRLARRFGKGRVWLAGDAAHVTSPFGAQSLNVGLSEVHSLVGRIAACAEGKAPISSLESYSTEFEREWHKLFGVNVLFDVLPHAPRWLSKYARRIVSALPASGNDLLALLARLGLRLS